MGHPGRLVLLVLGVVPHHELAAHLFGPQRLGLAHGVVGDHGVGGMEDGLGGAVVLLQHDGGGIGKGLLELQDVGDVGPSEPVDGLVAVPHHADVAVHPAEHEHQLVLGPVGVLVLVHQQVAEALLVVAQDLGVGLEQVHRHHQEVVEVHGAGRQQPLLVLLVHVGDAALVDGVGRAPVRLEVHQLVLGLTDHGMDAARRELLDVDVQVPQHVAGEAVGVGLVVDGERGAVTEPRGVPTQDAHAGGVEGGDPHALGHRAHQGSHALLHLVGRLVGEGDGEDLERRHAPVGDQVGDAVGEDPGLAGPRPGHDQQRSLLVEHRVPLDGVQPREQLGGGVDHHACPQTTALW